MSSRPARAASPGAGLLARRRAKGDRGTILVLYAMMMMGLLAMAALVLDLASLRQDRASDRAAADAAALAGVARLNDDPIAGTSNAVAACQQVWTYFRLNRPDATPVVTSPSCSATFSGICTGAARSTTGRAGPYTVTIRYPVPDSDPMMDAERIDGDSAQAIHDMDGQPCGRIGVQVVRDRDMVFGHAFGLGATTTDVHSVAVATTSNDARFPIALLILDPVGCGALIANGGGSIEVRASGANPGYISVDTDASQCTGGNFGIDAQGAGSTIKALGTSTGQPGIISLYALRAAACNAVDRACDPGDVASGTLAPTPRGASTRTGRTQVDWRFNCKASYGTLALRPCPYTGRQAYIDTLKSSIGTTGTPAGFTAYSPTYPCSIGPGAIVTVPQGNWFVNCPTLDVKGLITFTGGNTVFQGDVKVGSAGTLKMNTANTGSLTTACETTVCTTRSSANHSFAYIRSGGLSRVAGGSLELNNTFVYIANGTLDLTGGNGTINWTAPGTDRHAASGPFEDLSMWSESATDHGMSGGSGLVVDGVFFTPNALFTYSGTGNQIQAKAQFITYRLKVTGSGTLTMSPDPDRAIEFPLSIQRLIR